MHDERRGRAILDLEFREDALDVEFHRPGGQSQDHRDLGIGFAFRHPAQGQSIRCDIGCGALRDSHFLRESDGAYRPEIRRNLGCGCRAH